jgi:integrase
MWLAATTFPKRSFGDFKLAEINEQAAEFYIDARAKEVSLSTVKRDVAFLASFFATWLPKDDPKAAASVGNPFATPGVRKRLKDVTSRRDVRLEQFGEDAEKRLFAELERCRNPEMLQIVGLALTTGQRRGEILGLEWARVFPNHIQLRAIDTKSKKPRVVPLSKEAKEILAAIERKPETKRVFSYTADGFKSVWERVRTRAGLPELRFHDLRHTFVSRLLEVIASPVAAASIVGYKSIAHFEQQHVKPAKDRKELENGIQSERGLMLAVGHADNRMTAHYAADIAHKVMEVAEAARQPVTKYCVVVDESGDVASVFLPDFGLSAAGGTLDEALALVVEQVRKQTGDRPAASSPLAIAKSFPGAIVRQIAV